MIRINNIQQLRLEQRQLRLKKRQLEQVITNDWQELKAKIHPAAMVKDSLNKWVSGWIDSNTTASENSSNFFTRSIYSGIASLLRKIARNLNGRIDAFFGKTD